MMLLFKTTLKNKKYYTSPVYGKLYSLTIAFTLNSENISLLLRDRSQ